MRKIDLTEYMVDQDGKQLPYPMKEALAECLFAPDLIIRALDLLKRDDLARKIMAMEGDAALLEEAEYAMVKAAVEAITKYVRNDVEFVKRVLNAPQVEVAEVTA